jgi:hypothetical protein
VSTLTLFLCILAAPIGYAVGVLIADFFWWLTH